jgi:iron-sulfur cluster repair protein YtfE (RIC family)
MDNPGNSTDSQPHAAAAAPVAIEQLIESACNTHRSLISGHGLRINDLAEQACRANPTQEDLLLLRHRTRLLGEDLARLFEREEHGVFPMIRRLEGARSLRPCHVGMMRARVRFTVVDQEAILLTLSEVRSLTVVQLAPQVPCEICQAIALALDELSCELLRHHEFEQSILFRRATEREDLLASQIPAGQ